MVNMFTLEEEDPKTQKWVSGNKEYGQIFLVVTKPILIETENVEKQYVLQVGYSLMHPWIDGDGKVTGKSFPFCYDNWENNLEVLLSPGKQRFTCPVIEEKWYDEITGRPTPRQGAIPLRLMENIQTLSDQIPLVKENLDSTLSAMYFQGAFFDDTTDIAIRNRYSIDKDVKSKYSGF